MTVVFFLTGFILTSGAVFAESDPPTDRVPLKDARAKALRTAPGKVRDFEFEIRKDKWVYFFKIIGKDHRIHRIVVDAVTGKIVSKASEPMPEAKESAQSTPLSKK